MRDKVSGARRWVVKIGSALLTADGRGLDQAAMAVWVDQMVALREAGVELVLVSSGHLSSMPDCNSCCWKEDSRCLLCKTPRGDVRFSRQ